MQSLVRSAAVVRKRLELLRRAPFYLLYYAVARRLPGSTDPGGVLWKAIRVLACRRLFARCGCGVNVERSASFGWGAGVHLGDYSDIGVNARIHGTVFIGSHVMMGPDVAIWTNNHAFDRVDVPMTQQGMQGERPVVIEDDVWIGTRAILLRGVRIGRGAVIGAGAVVARDVPDWAIVVGNPARVVRYRNESASVSGAPAL
ncbi:MAG: acyltransferase [Chthonomonadales bacterium]|nr:acyltransferase [Chthonomonadales bacterium]